MITRWAQCHHTRLKEGRSERDSKHENDPTSIASLKVEGPGGKHEKKPEQPTGNFLGPDGFPWGPKDAKPVTLDGFWLQQGSVRGKSSGSFCNLQRPGLDSLLLSCDAGDIPGMLRPREGRNLCLEL